MLAMNGRLGDLTGFEPRALEGSPLPPPWWPPQAAERLDADIRGLWDGGPPVEGECTLLRSDGTNFLARVTWDTARDADRRPVGLVVTVEDVTERLLIEEAWQEARRTHELLADNSTDIVVRVSSSLRFLYLSPSVERVLGYALAEISGTRLQDHIHPDDLENVLREHRRLIRGADTATATFRARHRTGSWVWVEAISHALRDGDGRLIEVQSSARDITARRAAEEQSRKMAEELGFVARHAGDMISAHDPDGGFRTVSEASRALLGREPDELVGGSPLDHVHPEDRERVVAGLRRLRDGRAFVETLTYRVVRPDGSALWLDTTIRPIHDDDGGLSALIWVSRDATARLAAEREASDRAERSELEAAEQTALRRVAMAVANQSDSGPVLAMVAEEIPKLLEVDGGAVVRFDHDGEHATVVAASAHLPWRPDDRLLLEGTALASMQRNGRTSRAAAPLQSPGGHSAMVSAVAAPVRVDDALWGAAVAVGRPGGSVPAGAEARLERFAELVSVALVSHEQREQLKEQALEDPLTGLANHRAFHERLRTEVSRARRYGRPLSLALIDIDHFKRLNDLHGHQAGDTVLAALAGMLQSNARASELVARVGGEEFAWLLPETDGLTAMQAVERARAAIAGEPLWKNERITVSAGVSDLSRARDADELFRLADGARPGVPVLAGGGGLAVHRGARQPAGAHPDAGGAAFPGPGCGRQGRLHQGAFGARGEPVAPARAGDRLESRAGHHAARRGAAARRGQAGGAGRGAVQAGRPGAVRIRGGEAARGAGRRDHRRRAHRRAVPVDPAPPRALGRWRLPRRARRRVDPGGVPAHRRRRRLGRDDPRAPLRHRASRGGRHRRARALRRRAVLGAGRPADGPAGARPARGVGHLIRPRRAGEFICAFS